MNIGQLYFVGDRKLLTTLAASQAKWSNVKTSFIQFFSQLDPLKVHDDRSISDAKLPEDFVKRALEESGKVCYTYEDGSIKSYKFEGYKEVSVAEIYLQYGGDVLEHIFERGIDQVAMRKILKASQIRPENQ